MAKKTAKRESEERGLRGGAVGELFEVPFKDLPEDLLLSIARQMTHFTACFLYLDGRTRRSHQVGCGTFVRHGQEFGILTAAHVVDALRELPQWFVALPRATPIPVKHAHVHYVSTPPATVPADGPDIAVIRLSAPTAATFRAGFSFVNLPHHRAKLKRRRPRSSDGVWVHAGYPQSMGTETREEMLGIVTTGVYCLSASGMVGRRRRRDGFDYYDAAVKYDGQPNVPDTFRGMSGGGLWQFRLRKKDGRFEVEDSFLSGVVFYELAAKGVVRAIRSHGRESVYGYALRQLTQPS